jgi:hypothetical protein
VRSNPALLKNAPIIPNSVVARSPQANAMIVSYNNWESATQKLSRITVPKRTKVAWKVDWDKYIASKTIVIKSKAYARLGVS